MNNENIDVSELMSRLNSNQRAELDSILKDREKLNSVLNSPIAKQIMQNLNRKNNGQHS